VSDSRFTESTVEDAALAWLESTGWQIAHGSDIAPCLTLPAGRHGGRQATRPAGGEVRVDRDRLDPDVAKC